MPKSGSGPYLNCTMMFQAQAVTLTYLRDVVTDDIMSYVFRAMICLQRIDTGF